MSDEPLEEVPQRPLPKISIAWMLGMITVCAGLFTLLKLALAGSPWAQGATLLIAIVFGTMISYAVLFLLGLVIDAALTSIRPIEPPRPQPPRPQPSHPRRDLENSTKSTMLLMLLVLGFLPSGNANAQAVWQGIVPANAPRLGYTVTVSLYRHPGAGGYQAVRLKFTPNGGAFVRDHLMTVTVSSHQMFKTRVAASTTANIRINESDTAFTHELLIPQLGISDSLSVEVSEDGRMIGKRPLRISFNNQLDHRHASQSVTMGIIDPFKYNPDKRFPDLRAVSAIFGQTKWAKAFTRVGKSSGRAISKFGRENSCPHVVRSNIRLRVPSSPLRRPYALSRPTRQNLGSSVTMKCKGQLGQSFFAPKTVPCSRWNR